MRGFGWIFQAVKNSQKALSYHRTYDVNYHMLNRSMVLCHFGMEEASMIEGWVRARLALRQVFSCRGEGMMPSDIDLPERLC